jgi:hypothetical protein
MGTGSFLEVKCGQGVLLTTHPLLAPRSWKSRAIPLPPLGHNWACNGVTLPLPVFVESFFEGSFYTFLYIVLLPSTRWHIFYRTVGNLFYYACLAKVLEVKSYVQLNSCDKCAQTKSHRTQLGTSRCWQCHHSEPSCNHIFRHIHKIAENDY